jgi:hypothetical protein
MDATTIIDALKPLPTSKKPLYWTDQTDDGRSCWSTQPPELMEQVARVCGAVSVAGEHLTQATWDKAVAVAKKHKLAISVNCWPWGWSRTPKDARQDDATSPWVMQEYVAYKGWTQRVAAMAAASKVSISAVLIDHERWRMNTMEGFDKVEKLQALFTQAFPAAHCLWYANHQRVCDSKGWRPDTYGTAGVSDIACCNWYTMGEYEEMRQRHMKTAFGRNSIVPWLAMGWHYRRGWVMQGKQPIPYDSHCDDSAPSYNYYKAGCEMVKKEYDREPYITNSRIPCVVLHPGPGAHEEGDPREGMEWYRSFVPFAYGTCEAILPEVWR